MDTVIRIIAIPILMLLGIALKHAKVGLEPSHLELTIVYFTLPILMFTEILKMRLEEFSLGGIAGLGLLYLLICFIASYFSCKNLPSREKGTVVFNVTFFNSMFLPFPLIYALYGDLSVALIFSMPIAVLHNTVGIFMASYWGHGKIDRKTIVRAVTFPPFLAFLIGAFMRPTLADFVPTTAFNVLNTLGLTTIYLSLVLVGLIIPLSRELVFVFRNRIAGLITINRFLVSPIIAALLIIALNLEGVVKNTLIIMSFMPPAFTNLVITSKFNLDKKATAQSIFLPSLVSIVVVFILRFLSLI